MPEPEENTLGNYISPWQDFRNLQSVRIVEGNNGNPTLEARTPCGWIFHFAPMLHEHPVDEAEARRIAEVMNDELAQHKGTFEFEGWELVGAEDGSQAASFPDSAETRAVDAFWRGSGSAQLHQEHQSSRGKWN